MDFILEENKVIFKMSKKEHIEITLCSFNKSKKRQDIIQKISEKLKTKDIPLTVRIDKEYLYLSFDTDIIYGTSFDVKKYNEEVKLNPEADKKNIRIKMHKEIERKMLSTCIDNRVAGVG